MAGHWALHGVGMFVVEERQTGQKLLEGWGPGSRRDGRALKSAGALPTTFVARDMPVEAARAAIDWSFATFEIERNRALASIVKTLRRRPWRGGSVRERTANIDLFGHAGELWVTQPRDLDGVTTRRR